MDAYMFDTRGDADETYRFARGETILFAPLDDAGVPTRPARLERPLDFAALTDHASQQGEVALCTRPESPLYDTQACRTFRGAAPAADSPLGAFGARMATIAVALGPDTEVPGRLESLCGEGSQRCLAAMQSVWEEQLAAAERHYDRSEECRFTTFPAYEYTATPALTKVHHNVIFRNAQVPAAPIAWVDEPDVYRLWKALGRDCLDAGTGCDVLTIPHNPNLSSGRMFAITRAERDRPLEVQRARAALRARLEPLVEISQIKGDSECRNGFYQVLGEPDEFCDYEEWNEPDREDCEEGSGSGGLLGTGCVSRTDYVRYALIEGLREEQRIGINPYRLGIIAASDAHNANPGDTEEDSYQGWRGIDDWSPELRLQKPLPGQPRGMQNIASSPGGLAGVWAEENSRDSLFDAMKRRETFGTSGTRLSARFFAGWSLPDDLCRRSDLVAQGYAHGVPMGATLSARPPEGDAAPSFVVSALRDPGTGERPGGLLQRAQVIKGWVDEAGRFNQAVYDVAGGENGADVDLDSCTPRGPGASSLCTVWNDPDFDPDSSAVYYLRVLENPSCRWSQHECIALPEGERPGSCDDPAIPRLIQERLWSSPIWYDPALQAS
jgi:hypothetical protein